MNARSLNAESRMVLGAVLCALSAPIAVTFGESTAPAANNSVPLLLGYAGKKWDDDYGVVQGRCDRDALNVSSGRRSALLSGAFTAQDSMPQMDDKDRVCVGQALELSEIERVVTWTNRASGVTYRVMPLGGFTDNGKSCREFVTRMALGARNETVRRKACSGGDGVWHIVG